MCFHKTNVNDSSVDGWKKAASFEKYDFEDKEKNE